MSKLVHVALKLDPTSKRSMEGKLVAAGFEAVFVSDPAELVKRLGEIERLLIGRPPRIDWSLGAKLRLLHVAGAGVDPLFPAQGLPAQTIVSNSRGAHADAVRDHALAMVFAFARDLPRVFAQQTQKLWQTFPARPVVGQRLCVVGLGEIGQRVAGAGASLGFDVSGVCRSPRELAGIQHTLGPQQLGEGVSQCDYCVISLPLTSHTRGLFDREMLAHLPEQAVLINVSRGGIVDEAALEARLRGRELAGAALDVFADEPLPRSSSLWTCPRLVITPHCAGFTPDYLEGVVELFIDAVRRTERGERPRTEVSRENEY
jgi:D-2-hydroxyacid dehydrogenase (NADP+)